MITDVEVFEPLRRNNERGSNSGQTTHTYKRQRKVALVECLCVCVCVCAAGMRTHETQKVNVRDSECRMQIVPDS